jgi:hypothetical protein
MITFARNRRIGARTAAVAGFIASMLALTSGPAFTAGTNPSPCVVELFTSQGCSSCPPADRLLAQLAREPGVIALSFPVDYWDYIGWKDTFASPLFTARQKAYAASHGSRNVYTPQVVVDGVADAVGSDRDAIEHNISTIGTRDGVMSVPIRLADANGTLHIDIPAGTGGPAQLIVMRVMHSRTVAIGRGENSGESVTYTNVVRALDKIGEWDGAPKSFDLPKLEADGEGYVVLLQKGTLDYPGAILAAAKTKGL